MSLNRKAMVGAALAAPGAYAQIKSPAGTDWEFYGKFYPELTHTHGEGATAPSTTGQSNLVGTLGGNAVIPRWEMQISKCRHIDKSMPPRWRIQRFLKRRSAQMQRTYIRNGACGMTVLALALLSGCGTESSSNSSTGSGQFFSVLTVPGISSTTTYSFDLGAYDPATNKYYVTDRTNKSVDVVDVSSMTVTQFKPGFSGCNGSETIPGVTVAPGTIVPIPSCANSATGVIPKLTVVNDQSGPDGLDVVTNKAGASFLMVGDVNAAWILNKTTGAVIKKVTITSNPTGLRADEGCFDPDDDIYAIATPGDNNPFMTFIDVSGAVPAGTIIAKVVMDQPVGTPSQGLEACVYDTTTKKFFVNNDGSCVSVASCTSGPNFHGETDGIPAADIVAFKPTAPATVQYTALALTTQFVLNDVGATNNCDPTGIALGPGNDIGVMCREATGLPLNFLILDKTNGAIVVVPGAGGGDQITYDAASNNWFLATNRATANGISCGGGTAVTCPLTPMLTVVDGTSRTVTKRVPSGNNSHSVMTGGGFVFSPFTSGPSASAGGAGFPNGGIAVFLTR